MRITIWHEHAELGIVVADEGLGGADPAGGGLTGLRQRVEALDGWLEVTSPVGEERPSERRCRGSRRTGAEPKTTAS